MNELDTNHEAQLYAIIATMCAVADRAIRQIEEVTP